MKMFLYLTEAVMRKFQIYSTEHTILGEYVPVHICQIFWN